MKCFLFLILFVVQNAFAQSKPQLDFSKKENTHVYENERDNVFTVSLTRGFLSLDFPSIITGTSDFKQQLLGLRIGKKTDTARLINGAFEVALEWQVYKRSNGPIDQHANLLQLDLLQYFNWPIQTPKWRTTVAGGITPVYFTSEQSTLSNSYSQAGLMGSAKFDVLYFLDQNNEIDLGVKIGWGTINSEEIFLTTFGLGITFE